MTINFALNYDVFIMSGNRGIGIFLMSSTPGKAVKGLNIFDCNNDVKYAAQRGIYHIIHCLKTFSCPTEHEIFTGQHSNAEK